MKITLQGLHPQFDNPLSRASVCATQIAQLCQAENFFTLNNHAIRLDIRSDKVDLITAEIKHQIETLCFEAGLDVSFIKAERQLSDFKLVAMDMDSTLITIECIDEIADMYGLKEQVSQITESAMRGEIEFQQSLLQRVALLNGLNAEALERVYEERLELSLGAEKC